MNVKPKIHASWLNVLASEFQKPYFASLKSFLESELKKNQIIYPAGRNIFAAFNQCPFDSLKVVILGQDPYHGPRQANGLAFSVPPDQKIPPSLRNILKELNTDLGIKIPAHGDLSSWADQGVLLLNSTLTVRHKLPASHQGQGWEDFTDQVIRTCSDQKQNLVFILWGNFAQQKKSLIDQHKHLIIESSHPSPFSAHKGFIGSKPFSKTNEFLKSKQLGPIDWHL